MAHSNVRLCMKMFFDVGLCFSPRPLGVMFFLSPPTGDWIYIFKCFFGKGFERPKYNIF